MHDQMFENREKRFALCVEKGVDYSDEEFFRTYMNRGLFQKSTVLLYRSKGDAPF
jgi:hypothetical protein